MNVVSTAKVKPDIQEALRNQFPSVTFHFFSNINEVGEEMKDVEILITYGEDLQKDHIVKAEKLKWIMVISAGLDKMPFEVIKKKGIIVSNAKGIHKKPMAEYTISMMLQVARKTKKLIQQEQNKEWNRRVPMTEINSATLGILGAGAIGSEIARLAKAFGMKTIGINRSGQDVEHMDEVYTWRSIDKLLTESDYVVSVLPNTKETERLIDYRFFSNMKSSAVFINIGRGQSVVEADLLRAINEQKIAHAVLDVFEQEPLPQEHPFWNMENITVTPHISGLSPQYQYRAFEIFTNNLERYLDGNINLINLVDLNKGY